MSATLLRQWNMLRLIPRHPRKISVSELHAHLLDQGFSTTERTIQRDLLYLSGETFAITVDDRSRPHGWQWAQHADMVDIPGMEPQTALAFQLAQQFLQPMMAPSTLTALDPYFRQATRTLENGPEAVRTWPKKVRAITRGQRLIAPEIDPLVLNVVFDALFNDRQLQVAYLRRGDDAPRDYVVNPLGLVFRDTVVYLVCSLYDYDDVRQLALHRMQAAHLLESSLHRVEGFDLDVYLKQGAFDFRLGEEIALHIRVAQGTAQHLAETPLSHDQTMDASEREGWMDIRATVPDTSQLRWWILGMGSNIEVRAPAGLREDIVSSLECGLAQYK